MEKEFLFLGWTEKLSTGIPSIDEQHKIMLKIINKLFEEIFSTDLKIRPEATYSKLKVYIDEHFKYEEELFEKYKWYDRQEHIQQHQYLKVKLEETKMLMQRTEDQNNAIIMLNFLKDWVSKHILKEDKNYSQFLISKGVK